MAQIQFELVEDQILLEGFVHKKSHKTVVVEDVLIYENPKTRKFIKMEKGGTKFDTNIFGEPNQWPKEDLQGYIDLLLESSRIAEKENKKYEVFFKAKSLVTGAETFTENFKGFGSWRTYTPEQDAYIEMTINEADHFFQTGECSFALQR